MLRFIQKLAPYGPYLLQSSLMKAVRGFPCKQIPTGHVHHLLTWLVVLKYMYTRDKNVIQHSIAVPYTYIPELKQNSVAMVQSQYSLYICIWKHLNNTITIIINHNYLTNTAKNPAVCFAATDISAWHSGF